MIIHYACNLRCQHCSIAANADQLPEGSSMSFAAASREMQAEFDKGAKILFFEGGEPTIWKDGDKGLPDLIAEGRRIGYYVIGYTTNGTGRIFEESDVLSISLDGPRDVHDRIRGPGVYDKLMANLEMTDHPNIFANMLAPRFVPHKVVLLNEPGAAGERVRKLSPLTQGQGMKEGRAVAHVCTEQACLQETADPEAFASLLRRD